uniref:Sodefrin-like factor n=1 Tax=Panagrolaimus sp. PS1159 TaxID=55785 RepID=A0AC35F689_9BILA
MKNFFFLAFISFLGFSECIRCEVSSGGIPSSPNFECPNGTKFCIDLNVTTIETSIAFKVCDDGLFVGDIQLKCAKPGTTNIDSPNVKGTQFCCNTDLCNLDPNDISTTLPSNSSFFTFLSVSECLRCEESVNGVLQGTNILCPDGTQFCISLYLTVYGTLLNYKECSEGIGIWAGDKQFFCD